MVRTTLNSNLSGFPDSPGSTEFCQDNLHCAKNSPQQQTVLENYNPNFRADSPKKFKDLDFKSDWCSILLIRKLIFSICLHKPYIRPDLCYNSRYKPWFHLCNICNIALLDCSKYCKIGKVRIWFGSCRFRSLVEESVGGRFGSVLAYTHGRYHFGPKPEPRRQPTNLTRSGNDFSLKIENELFESELTSFIFVVSWHQDWVEQTGQPDRDTWDRTGQPVLWSLVS